jgi:hypothetical protein
VSILFGTKSRIPEFETDQWVSAEVIENKPHKEMARPERFELPTLWFEAIGGWKSKCFRVRRLRASSLYPTFLNCP